MPFSFRVAANALRGVNVEPALFLYIVFSSFHFPVFQALIYTKVCFDAHGNDSYCANLTSIRLDTELQTNANRLFLFSSICLTLPSIFVSIFVGSVSDAISRKLAVLIPFIGLFLADASYLLQISFMEWNSYFILLSDLAFGLFGGFSGIFTGMFSYAAASSGGGYARSLKMSFMEACLGLGGTLGYVLSGVVLRATSYFFVYCIVTVLHVLAALYALVFLKKRPTPPTKLVVPIAPNSVDAPLRRSFASRSFTYVREFVRTLVRERPLSGRKTLAFALLAFSISYIVFSGSDAILFYYLVYQLDFTSTMYGYFRGTYFGSSSLMVLVVFPLLKRYFRDSSLALVGMVSRLLGCVMFAFAFSPWFVYSVPVVYMFNRFAATGLRALCSKIVESGEQGKLFAAISFLEGLCTLAASAIFNTLYPASLMFEPRPLPELSFIVMAIMMLAPIACIIYISTFHHPIDAAAIPPACAVVEQPKSDEEDEEEVVEKNEENRLCETRTGVTYGVATP